MNVQDMMIVLILAIILVPAIKSTVIHMKGEGACCGGPKEKAFKKKLHGKPKSKLLIRIDGMQCDNCKNRVERHLNELDGVVSKVKLSRKLAKVWLYQEVDEALIRDTIEKLEFKVTNIENVR